MSRITLKDKHFRIIGYIETRSDGVHVGKDAHFRIVGQNIHKLAIALRHPILCNLLVAIAAERPLL